MTYTNDLPAPDRRSDCRVPWCTRKAAQGETSNAAQRQRRWTAERQTRAFVIRSGGVPWAVASLKTGGCSTWTRAARELRCVTAKAQGTFDSARVAAHTAERGRAAAGREICPDGTDRRCWLLARACIRAIAPRARGGIDLGAPKRRGRRNGGCVDLCAL